MWKNKQYGKNNFKGRYERDRKGERIFVLTSVEPSKMTRYVVSYRRVTFESWQAAKKLGWKLYRKN